MLLVESTGNRPDLQSIYGIAREVAALYDLPLAELPGSVPGGAGAGRRLAIAIDDLDGCPRYIGRLFEDVADRARRRCGCARGCSAAGMRPISNVVDVTNYVMLALGSPLHAFDFTTLAERRIVVRRAAPGERLRTLDGVERELVPDDLVIADAERAVALAGIMGGEETEIADGTTTVLLEAANFEPHGDLSHARSASGSAPRAPPAGRRASTRTSPRPSADLATALLLALAGGAWTARRDVHGELPERPLVPLPPRARGRADRRRDPARAAVRDPRAARLRASRRRRRRPDLARARRRARGRRDRGDRALPARATCRSRCRSGARCSAALAATQGLRRRVEDALVGLGFAETYTPSLRPDDDTAWRLPEPISVELTALRTTLLPSLDRGGAPQRRRRRAPDRALRDRTGVSRRRRACRRSASGWPGIAEGGFLAVKGVVESLYAALKAEPVFSRATPPLFHPGKTASTPAGVLGELHPRALDGEWGAFELDLHELFAAAHEPVVYRDVITYPAVRQDIAVAVAEEVPVGDLVAAAREAVGAGATGDEGVRRVSRRPGGAGTQVGRLLGRLPVGRADVLGGGREPPARRPRRRARRAFRRRAAHVTGT